MIATETKTVPESDLSNLSIEERQRILALAEAKAEADEIAKAAREAFIASLPLVTSDQVKALVTLHRVEADIPEGLKDKQDFRLTDWAKDQIAAAKKARADELTAKKEQILDELKVDGSRLESMRVRSTAKQTTKTLKFVTRVGKRAGNGLIDRLRREGVDTL